jgi:hypothetical protein
MQGLRSTDIPVDHLVAEIAAIPFASPISLRLALHDVPEPEHGPAAHRGSRPRSEAARRLWRETEAQLVGSFPGISLDELANWRDRLWYDPNAAPGRTPGTGMPLHRLLRQVAHNHLEARGPIARPFIARPDEHWPESNWQSLDLPQDLRGRQRWRWLSFALPADLLLAALDGGRNAPTRVETVSPPIANLLQNTGFAETHVHLGSSFAFAELWPSALRSLLDVDSGDFLASPGAALDEGRELGWWLLRAAICRVVLGLFLESRGPRHPVAGEGLRQWLESIVDRPDAAPQQAAPWIRSAHLRSMVDVALGDLATGSLTAVAWRPLQRAYGELRRQLVPSATAATDPLEDLRLTVDVPADALGERRWVRAGLDHLERIERGAATADPLFAVVFWQCVRIRCLFFRHVVLRPMTPGLPWFIRTFGRLAPVKRHIQEKLRLAAIAAGLGRGLRSFEFRMGPPDDCQEVRDSATAAHKLLRAGRQADLERVAIVYHFKKDREGNRDGLPPVFDAGGHGDPRSPRNRQSGLRYSGWYLDEQRTAYVLGRALERWPGLLAFVRGVDVCSDETAVPSWACRPLIHIVRSAARRAGQVLASQFGIDLPPLRTTIHSGEDFVHLTTGLRHLWETVHWTPLISGDRIGHGTALGIDAGVWAQRTGRLPIPLEERLGDLVWEWHLYAQTSLPCSSSRSEFLQNEIGRLADRMLGSTEAPTPRVLFEAWKLLQDPQSLREMGFPRQRRAVKPGRGPLAIAARYLGDADVFRRGRETIWVDPAAEGPVIEGMQRLVRSIVSRTGIAVEINPSSNLLIGNLGDMKNHPLWRLSSPRGSADGLDIPIVVGTDNPLTMATNLPEEYMLLYDGLVAAGISSADAEAWLERACKNSLTRTFALPVDVLNRHPKMLDITDHCASWTNVLHDGL